MKQFFIGLLVWTALTWGYSAHAQNTQAGLTPCGAGVSISVSSVSGNTQLSNCGGTIIVYNIGSVEVFLNWGTASNVAATTSGWSLPPGFAVTLNAGRAPLFIAAITASGSSTVRIVQGNGAPAVAGGAPTTGGGLASAVTEADGANVTQGTTTDAACATDNGTCTVLAVIKRVAQRLTTIITALGTPLQAGGNLGTVTAVTAITNPVALASQYPSGATPITGNAAGSTGAVVGTLANTGGKTTYICGFNVSGIGGVASLGPVTVAGLTGSSMVFQLTSAAAAVNFSQSFSPCIPASAVNTAITTTTTADGTATAVDVNSWGYQL